MLNGLSAFKLLSDRVLNLTESLSTRNNLYVNYQMILSLGSSLSKCSGLGDGLLLYAGGVREWWALHPVLGDLDDRGIHADAKSPC